MIDSQFLTNQFLIAMPNLLDPNFFHSVTYICEHNENGAMGIVINQPVDFTVEDLINQLDLETSSPDSGSESDSGFNSSSNPGFNNKTIDQPVYRGGPVETERGFVLHHPLGAWESTLSVTDEIGVSSSNDIIQAIALGKGPSQCLVALGYAGWGAGQLEQEMVNNAWLSGPSDSQIIFESEVEQRWEKAARLLGVDINQMTGDSGHA
jgi:putative transcriptional regulator